MIFVGPADLESQIHPRATCQRNMQMILQQFLKLSTLRKLSSLAGKLLFFSFTRAMFDIFHFQEYGRYGIIHSLVSVYIIALYTEV